LLLQDTYAHGLEVFGELPGVLVILAVVQPLEAPEGMRQVLAHVEDQGQLWAAILRVQ